MTPMMQELADLARPTRCARSVGSITGRSAPFTMCRMAPRARRRVGTFVAYGFAHVPG